MHDDVTHTPTQPHSGERELNIEVCRDMFVEYKGTAAQLIAEGLIPKDFEWPSAALSEYWQANGCDYGLRRTRPDGHKGPMRSWMYLDNWAIRISVIGRDGYWCIRQGLKRKAEELAVEHYRLTAAGAAELHANCDRYFLAVRDVAYQAFKNKVPGLIPPKRGRKPRAATAPDSAAA